MASLGFFFQSLPFPAIIVMIYGTLVLGLAERGQVYRATFVVMVAVWLTGMLVGTFRPALYCP